MTVVEQGRRAQAGCAADRAGNVTRSLLGYLVLAGPFYVAVSLTQAFTRDGFDPLRHEWSLLAVGHLGWIQSTNLILTGLMTIAGAVGLSRMFQQSAPKCRAGGWLLGGYGTALAAAGIWRADASHGFPVGTPPGPPADPSLHGTLHLVSGAVGFVCLVLSCFVIARAAARAQRRGWTIASGAVGVVCASTFAALAAGAGTAAFNLAFTAAVIISYVWLTALAVASYRHTRRTTTARTVEV